MDLHLKTGVKADETEKTAGLGRQVSGGKWMCSVLGHLAAVILLSLANQIPVCILEELRKT